MSNQNTRRTALTLPRVPTAISCGTTGGRGEIPLAPDRLGKRLRVAIVASLLVNIIGWRAVAAMAKRPLYVAPRPVEITRVIIDKKGHKIEKKITKEQIKKHVAQIKKTPVVKIHPVAFHQHQPPKPQNYNKVITAPDKGPGNGGEPNVPPGGNADVGKAIEQQPEPTPPPAPEIKPMPTPPPVVTKAPEVNVKPPDPTPPPPVVHQDPPPIVQPDPPVRKGPSKEAEPTNEVKPEIPDSLRHGDFKSFVRVKVEIDESGNATPILRTSSGNLEVDQRVLDALKKWRWKPALQNGEPVKSTQLFKFEFLVE